MTIRLVLSCLLAILLVAGIAFVGDTPAKADNDKIIKKRIPSCGANCARVRRRSFERCMDAGALPNEGAAIANSFHERCMIGCKKRVRQSAVAEPGSPGPARSLSAPATPRSRPGHRAGVPPARQTRRPSACGP